MANNKLIIPKSSELSISKSGLLIKRGIELSKEYTKKEFLPDWYSIVHRQGWVRDLYLRYNLFVLSDKDFSRLKGDVRLPNLLNIYTDKKWPSMPELIWTNCHKYIWMDTGYVFDFVYDFDESSGRPLIYARKEVENPIQSSIEYFQKFNITKREISNFEDFNSTLPFLNHINYSKPDYIWQKDDTEFYFGFALFCTMVHQFFLYGNFITSNRWLILNESEKQYFINQRIGINSEEEADYIRSIKIDPFIRLKDKYGEITLFSFKYGIGYSFAKYMLEWPNVFLGIQDDIVLPSIAKSSENEELEIRIILAQFDIIREIEHRST